MSNFRTIVESILSKSLKEDWETDLDWIKTHPYDNDEDDEYEEWVERMSEDLYTKYAIYVQTEDKYGKEYACQEQNCEKCEDKGWGLNNELDKGNPDFLQVWDTPEEAQKAMAEYKAIYPEKDPKVVKVYSEEEDGIYHEDIEHIFDWDRFQNEKYGY